METLGFEIIRNPVKMPWLFFYILATKSLLKKRIDIFSTLSLRSLSAIGECHSTTGYLHDAENGYL